MRLRPELHDLFFQEPPGRFALGHILSRATPAEDLAHLLKHKNVGQWHCDIANNDALTWSDRVYEIFGVPLGAGSGVNRQFAAIEPTHGASWNGYGRSQPAADAASFSMPKSVLGAKVQVD